MTNDTPKPEINDVIAWKYAVQSQDYTGTFEDWQAMDSDERQEYEDGAAGIGTV